MTQYDLEKRWLTAEGIPGVTYQYSELVCVKNGEHRGKEGEVIALISLNPEPVYVVVFPPDEESAVLPQSELEPTGENAGRTLILVPFKDQ